jgi:hypothetical protein
MTWFVGRNISLLSDLCVVIACPIKKTSMIIKKKPPLTYWTVITLANLSVTFNYCFPFKFWFNNDIEQKPFIDYILSFGRMIINLSLIDLSFSTRSLSDGRPIDFQWVYIKRKNTIQWLFENHFGCIWRHSIKRNGNSNAICMMDLVLLCGYATKKL